MNTPDSVITALFALLGVIIGIIFTGIGGRKKRFNETVSQRRVDWIRQMSEHIGTALACATLIFKSKEDKETLECSDKYCNMLLSFYKSKYHIMAQLNASEAEHQHLILLLDKLDNIISQKDSEEEFKKTKDGILSIVRIIEKIEWDKTKNEAQGEKR